MYLYQCDDGQYDLMFILVCQLDGYPPTVNAYPECVEVVKTAAAKVVGVANAGLPQKTMGAEDFSYFLQQRPGMLRF